MSKEIRYAGFSVVADGTFKFRTASDQRRIDQLIGFGEQVSMILLDRPAASKSQAAKQLLAQKDGWLPEAVELFVKTARDDNPFAKPRKKSGTVRVKSTKADPVEAYFMSAEVSNVRLTPKQAAKLRAEFNARVKAAYDAN